jgi:hypothetical protein
MLEMKLVRMEMGSWERRMLNSVENNINYILKYYLII